jgi:hypothetical protein
LHRDPYAARRDIVADDAFERRDLGGVISHDVSPSGVGVAVQTDQFRVYWSRRLSEEMEFILDGSLIRNRALAGSSAGIDRRYLDIGPQLRWRRLENVYIVATYRYRNQKFDALPDTAEGNAVFLGLSYRL